MVSRVVELFKALDLLSRRSGTTIMELAEELDMDRKAVDRLLNLIQDIGIPVAEPEFEGREKVWRVIPEYASKLRKIMVTDLPLTLQEIVALYLLKGEARIGKHTEIQKRADSAFDKIGQLVPPGVFSQLNRINSLFTSSEKFAKDYSGKEKIIDGCTDAMLRKRTCYVRYHSFSSDEIKNFKIDPLCFFENNGGLYLFVNTTSFGEIRTLAVERIQEITPTDLIFESPEDFDPHALLDSAFDIAWDDPIEVKIWVSEDQARYVKERTWAKGQIITDQLDGSIILEMKTSGWWHVKKWVLSFGCEARVLEPEQLRNDVAQELGAAFAAYQQSRSRRKPENGDPHGPRVAAFLGRRSKPS